ncbi:hypothetical protein Krac_1665 [Ktedonobacter racemifer DSM 44963]|uniref:Uncharacterized protein n=1 Tax=Ktedonobacter racemifer DSM 44963 TaxID=485913 RepID=D6U2P4_KTERA|nr:hypothetical protein Krac_1665 [Ktedonobacter racemifer DSM 44963]
MRSRCDNSPTSSSTILSLYTSILNRNLLWIPEMADCSIHNKFRFCFLLYTACFAPSNHNFFRRSESFQAFQTALAESYPEVRSSTATRLALIGMKPLMCAANNITEGEYDRLLAQAYLEFEEYKSSLQLTIIYAQKRA